MQFVVNQKWLLDWKISHADGFGRQYELDVKCAIRLDIDINTSDVLPKVEWRDEYRTTNAFLN